MWTVISYALLPLVVLLGLAALMAAARHVQARETEDGVYLLEYAKALKVFGIIMPIVPFSLIIIVLIRDSISDTKDLYLAILVITLLILFVIYFYIELFTVKVWVGRTGIRGTSGWRGYREYKWNQISKITYSKWSMWFKILSEGKKSLRIHAMISGIDKFQEHYIRYLPEEKWNSAHEKYYDDDRVSN